MARGRCYAWYCKRPVDVARHVKPLYRSQVNGFVATLPQASIFYIPAGLCRTSDPRKTSRDSHCVTSLTRANKVANTKR